MNFNTKQKAVIEANDRKILCLAAAAAGKTRVLTERIRYLINKGVPQNKIVAITFTKLAAAEMKNRLQDIATNELFIGTIHSYALKICNRNDISVWSAIKQEEYDEILRAALSIPQDKLDTIEHLLIDEAQDLTKIEYTFINNLPVSNIFYIGDIRQCIYQFRGGSSEFLATKYYDKDYQNYYLNINYRNAPNILSFADSLIASHTHYGLDTVAAREEDGELKVDVSLLKALEDLEDSGEWGKWAILARTNNEIDMITKKLEERDIPNITFKRSDFDDDPDAIERATKLNAVKVLTIHSAKGLEFPYVIAVGCKTHSEPERNLSYVAATRAIRSLYWCKAIKGSRKARGTYKKGFWDKVKMDEQVSDFG